MMLRSRLTPPTFCGVRMFRTNFGLRCKVGNWLCNIIESADETKSRFILNGELPTTGSSGS